MASTVRIKRRISGNAGAPSTLKNAELAYNEIDNTLYYGKGDLGDGSASSVIAIGGEGVFATIDYVDGAIADADLDAYAKKEADNTFAVGYTNTFNGTVNLAGTVQIGGTQVTSTAAELNLLDGSVANTVINSRAVIYGAAGEIAATSLTVGNITATGTLTLSGTALTATAAELNVLDGIQAEVSELNFLADVTPGTGSASKAVVLDALKNIDIGTGSVTCTNVTTAGNVHVGGNLTVSGTLTTIESVTLAVSDKNIELGVTETPTDATADNGGITLKASTDGTNDKKISWVLATACWTSNQDFDLTSGSAYHIAGNAVLSHDTLGSGVLYSSLESLGVVETGEWQATVIALEYGGTGATTAQGARNNLELGSMALQASDNVAITGGTIDGIVLDGGTF